MDGGETNPTPAAAAAADIDMADLASLDGTAASTRFRPKIKGKPKTKPEAKPKPEPKPVPGPEALAALEVDEVGGEEEEDDFVVREIDVYFTPDCLDEDTLLYVMQYPLRPRWRPYELDEICEEVRVRPKRSKVEVELSIDTEGESYDPEVAAHLRLLKQTLSSSSSGAPASVADYAVGVLRGNLVHLNHIDAVVQLRPSASHVNADEQSIRRTLQHGEMNEDAHEHKEDSEPWISLEYHPVESRISSEYRDKMISNESGPIDFTMSTSAYVVSLCPATWTDGKDTKEGRARREVLPLPLEQRLRKWLTEVSQVNRFDALMHLAPTYSEEDVLKVLQVYADLVRGLWVCKSSLLYDDDTAYKRDLVLLQFTKKDSIHISELEKCGIKGELRKEIMGPLSVPRKLLKDTKFISPVDSLFVKRYPHIVKEQDCAWSAREMTIRDSLSRLSKTDPRKFKNSSKSNVSSSVVGSTAEGTKPSPRSSGYYFQ